jgi:hypothetical protein
VTAEVPGSVGAEIVMVNDLSPATSDCRTGALGTRLLAIAPDAGIIESETATTATSKALMVFKTFEPEGVVKVDIYSPESVRMCTSLVKDL